MELLRYFLSKLFPAASFFIFVKLAFDGLGAEGYGEYSLLYAKALLLVSFVAGFLKQILLKFYVDNLDIDEDISIFFTMLIVFISFGACLFLFVIDFDKFLILTILALAIALQTLYLTFCQVTFKSSSFLKSEIIRSFFILLVGVFAYQIGFGYKLLIIFFSLSYILAVAPKFYLRLVIKTKGIKKLFTKERLSYALPISFWLMIQSAFPLIERENIANYFSVEVLGNYALVTEYTVRIFGLLLMPFTLAIHPRVMSYYNVGDYKKLNSTILKALLTQLVIIGLYVLFLFHFSVMLFDLISPNLDKSITSLSWLFALVGACWQVSMISQKYFEVSGATLLMFSFLCLSLFLYIVLTRFIVFSETIHYFIYVQLISAATYLVLTLLYGVYFNLKYSRNLCT